MKYKDLQNRIHEVEPDKSFLLPVGCIQITDEEAAALLAPTPEQQAVIDAAIALQQADNAAKLQVKADNVVNYLVTHTPAEILAYVNTNVTDLTSAKNVLGKLAIAVAVLSKKELR